MFPWQALTEWSHYRSIFLHRQYAAWERVTAEASSLRALEAEARRCAEEAEKKLSDLSDRLRRGNEEELDDLRRHDAESHRQVLDLRGELEKEKGLTLAAKEAASALDVKAIQDAAATEWLRQERDDSRRTESCLRSERDSSHKNLAGARHQVNSMEGELAQSQSCCTASL